MSAKDWGGLAIHDKIGIQLQAWTKHSQVEKKPFITISREFGSEGWILAQELERKLNDMKKFDPPWMAYNKEVISMVEKSNNLSAKLVESLEKPANRSIEEFFENYFSSRPPRIAIFKKTARTIKSLASHGHVIIVGRGGCFVTQGMEKGFHVRIVAPFGWRVEQIMQQKNISKEESEQLVRKMEKERDTFIKDYFFTDVWDPHYYHLVINSAGFKLNDAAELIISAMKKNKLI